MNVIDACLGCVIRLANDQEPVCDGSGVLAISDYPRSRVVVCPEWDIDQDEPLAYWEALAAIDDDRMPLTMQQRIRNTVMAQVDAAAPYMDEPADEVKRVPMIVSATVLALVTLAVVVGICWPWGGLQ